ncbi:MAG: helix-turn-helix domain-containing protein [[Eubacterium] siraeum]|jgi:predicted transcriptional regulators
MSHYQRLRDLREDSDKTQQEIADYLGTSAQHYGKYESGKAEIPLERAVLLAKYYNVSLDYIAGISSSRHPLDLDNLSSPAEILSDKITQLSDNEKQAVKDTLSSVIDMIK